MPARAVLNADAAPWLASVAGHTLFAVLDGDARWVGGCVRDALLGRVPKDLDIATPLPPGEVMRRLDAAGVRTVPTGLAHGTVTAVIDHVPYEITTLRRDISTDGRHAIVEFTDDWQADAARRDFTMNALSADSQGNVHDYFGGVDDLAAGRVRFVGDPRQRIHEDVLRLLRFFRFHAWYGRGTPDKAALAACTDLAPLLPTLSGERVHAEILRLLESAASPKVWALMHEGGILAPVLPEANRAQAIPDLDALVRLEGVVKAAPDPLRRLGILLPPGNSAGVAAIASRLRLSRLEGTCLNAMVQTQPANVLEALPRPATLRRLLYRWGVLTIHDRLLLEAARARAPAISLTPALALITSWRRPTLPLTGADLISRGTKPGPALGAALNAVESWWIEHDFQPNRAACLAELERLGEGME